MSLLIGERLGLRIGGKTLLNELDLRLGAGDMLGIVGTNGAGKTTLLRALAGLVRPTRGGVLLAGRSLATWQGCERARHLAYLPQGQVVHWPLPGRELVALGRLPHGDALRPTGREAIARAMAATTTQDFANTAAHTLSGGERARLLLARVLAGEPRVLLADEPLAALDAAHQLRMLDLLRQQARSGCAVALVLHDLALAARFCTRVAVLHQGRLLADGPPDRVLDAALIARAFCVSAVRVDHAGEACLLPWQPLPFTPAPGPTGCPSP